MPESSCKHNLAFNIVHFAVTLFTSAWLHFAEPYKYFSYSQGRSTDRSGHYQMIYVMVILLHNYINLLFHEMWKIIFTAWKLQNIWFLLWLQCAAFPVCFCRCFHSFLKAKISSKTKMKKEYKTTTPPKSPTSCIIKLSWLNDFCSVIRHAFASNHSKRENPKQENQK